jgi:UDP-N-acetylglucosamine/UDP-N-acetylgalactosamine diphosphorylase
LSAPGRIATGPNGNGYAFKALFQSGIGKTWADRGVADVTVIPVENPLADPFDAEQIGLHRRKHAQLTLKVTERRDVEEKVGVVVRSNNRLKIIEYTELSPKEKAAMGGNGLKHFCANLNLFCYSMDFVKNLASDLYRLLPWHFALKKAPQVSETGEILHPDEPNAWKFEAALFDTLSLADEVAVLLCPRERCFAPLKNAEGSDSPEEVRKWMQDRDREVFRQISQTRPSEERRFELHPQFYYPTEALLERWQGQTLPTTDYIE